MSSGGGGGGDSSAQAAQIQTEFAKEQYRDFKRIFEPTQIAEQEARRETLPARTELTQASLASQLAGVGRYEAAVPGLERQLMGGIQEGLTDRTEQRVSEAVGTARQQGDIAMRSTERQQARRGGLGLSTNQKLIGNLATASSATTAANRAREQEIARLDAAKVALPAQGIATMSRLGSVNAGALTGQSGQGASLQGANQSMAQAGQLYGNAARLDAAKSQRRNEAIGTAAGLGIAALAAFT